MQTLVNVLAHAYTQILILILLIVYLFMHRDQRLAVSGIRIVRTILVVVIFFYFMFIWASSVNPTLHTISLTGMYVVNFYMLYTLLLARMERPYRDALEAIGQQPEKHEAFHDIWHYGKRFYYLDNFLESLFSGHNPFRFIHAIATDRVREDIKERLRHYGVEKKLISLEMLKGYLHSQLAADKNLPMEFKNTMDKAIEDFSTHPWIEEKVNEFLNMVIERPEDLHYPEWMERFEKFTAK
jgi:Ca2+/Na+ antiporter